MTGHQLNDRSVEIKRLIINFAKEYGYDLIDCDKSIIIKGDGKSIEIFHKIKMLSINNGNKKKCINVISALMIAFDHFIYPVHSN